MIAYDFRVDDRRGPAVFTIELARAHVRELHRDADIVRLNSPSRLTTGTAPAPVGTRARALVRRLSR